MSRPFFGRSFGPREPLHRRNGKIRAREVRVLDENKEPLGVMALGDALRLAQSKRLDLIEIAPDATPPVCRILEYGKFQYQESKKKKESSHSGNRMKELQLSANIDPHDFGVKLAHAIDFLCDDLKVRVKLRFRGRQKAHKEIGFEMVNRFIVSTAAYGRADTGPKMLGDRDLSVIINPLPREKRAQRPGAAKPTAASQAHGAPADQSPASEGPLR